MNSTLKVTVIRQYLPTSYEMLVFLAKNWQYNILSPAEFKAFVSDVSKDFADILRKASDAIPIEKLENPQKKVLLGKIVRTEERIFNESLTSVRKFLKEFDTAILNYSHGDAREIVLKEVSRWKYRFIIAHLTLSRFFERDHGNSFFIGMKLADFEKKCQKPIPEGYKEFLTESVDKVRTNVVEDYVT